MGIRLAVCVIECLCLYVDHSSCLCFFDQCVCVFVSSGITIALRAGCLYV